MHPYTPFNRIPPRDFPPYKRPWYFRIYPFAMITILVFSFNVGVSYPLVEVYGYPLASAYALNILFGTITGLYFARID